MSAFWEGFKEVLEKHAATPPPVPEGPGVLPDYTQVPRIGPMTLQERKIQRDKAALRYRMQQKRDQHNYRPSTQQKMNQGSRQAPPQQQAPRVPPAHAPAAANWLPFFGAGMSTPGLMQPRGASQIAGDGGAQPSDPSLEAYLNKYPEINVGPETLEELNNFYGSASQTAPAQPAAPPDPSLEVYLNKYPELDVGPKTLEELNNFYGSSPQTAPAQPATSAEPAPQPQTAPSVPAQLSTLKEKFMQQYKGAKPQLAYNLYREGGQAALDRWQAQQATPRNEKGIALSTIGQTPGPATPAPAPTSKPYTPPSPTGSHMVGALNPTTRAVNNANMGEVGRLIQSNKRLGSALNRHGG